MAGQDGKAFRLIQVHDDGEELVVRAGSGLGGAPAADAARADAAPQPAAPAEERPQDAEKPAAPDAASKRTEALRRRAEELEQAEAGLVNPHAHAGMHRSVIIALVVLVLVVVAYSLAMHA